MRAGMVGLGALLVTIGVTPTPDDLTIVSPAIQILGGLGLIAAGIVLPAEKK